MNKTEWLKRLKAACEEAGTYREPFSAVLETLAEVLEQRDRVLEQYQKEGSHALITAMTDRGSVNQKENPLLRTWRDLNVTALAYFKEMGLSAKSLKAEPPRRSALEEAIEKISAAAVE